MQTEVSHWPQDRSDSGPERDGQDMGTIKPGNTLSSLVSASTGCPSPSPPTLPHTHTHTRPSLSQHDPHTQAALSPTGPHRSVHTTTDPPSVGRGESTCRLPQLGLFALDLHSGLRPFPHQRFHLFPLPSPQLHPIGSKSHPRVNTFPWPRSKTPVLFPRASNFYWVSTLGQLNVATR